MCVHNSIEILHTAMVPIKNKTNNNKHIICQPYNTQLQKKVKSNPKQPSCKKSVAPKNAVVKKMQNPKWWPRNGCNSRLKEKILIMTIQVNLLSNRSEIWRRQHKFTWIVVVKIFAFSLPSQPFLGRHFRFPIFSQQHSWGPHTFLQLGCCCLDSIMVLIIWLFHCTSL